MKCVMEFGQQEALGTQFYKDGKDHRKPATQDAIIGQMEINFPGDKMKLGTCFAVMKFYDE